MVPAWLAPYWQGFTFRTKGCGWELEVEIGPAGFLFETSRLPDDASTTARDAPAFGFRPATEAHP